MIDISKVSKVKCENRIVDCRANGCDEKSRIRPFFVVVILFFSPLFLPHKNTINKIETICMNLTCKITADESVTTHNLTCSYNLCALKLLRNRCDKNIEARVERKKRARFL